MEILLTTYETVILDDLSSVEFVHPQVDYNLTDEFDISKLRRSTDLQQAIDDDRLLLTIGGRPIQSIKHPLLNLNTKVSDLLVNYADICYMDFDFTLILSKVETKFDKGRKFERYYSMPGDIENLAVKKSYADIIGDREINGVDHPNMLLGIKILIQWYNKDNTIDPNFKEIDSLFNRAQAGEYLVKRRSRNTDNLKGMAVGTAVESHVAAIFMHYSDEIQEYIEAGTDSFKLAMANETDPTMINILAIEIPSTLLGRVASIKDIVTDQIQ